MLKLSLILKVVAVCCWFATSGFAQELPVPDRQLAASIEKDWIASDALKSHRLKVTADQDSVTISGQVAKLFEREVAVRLARWTNGVITVIDQIEINAMSRPDSVLKQDAINALKVDPATKDLTLAVTAVKGAVTVSGEAATRGQRGLVGKVVSGVKGMQRVVNHVKSAEHGLTDKELTETIHELLKNLTSHVSKRLQESGLAVVGIDSMHYFWKEKQASEAAMELQALITDHTRQSKVDYIILLGYSMGADVLPAIARHLPDTQKYMIHRIVLMSPGRRSYLKFRFVGWLGFSPPERLSTAILPDLDALTPIPISCFAGEKETDSPANDHSLANTTVEFFPDGHHYGGDYDRLADRILNHLEHRSH